MLDWPMDHAEEIPPTRLRTNLMSSIVERSPMLLIPDSGGTQEEDAYYSLNQRVYRKFARFYDLVALPLKRLRKQVVELSAVSSDSIVLDVATGTGQQAFAFAARCREVIGIDISEEMLEIARKKRPAPNLKYVRANAVRMPFADAQLDVACISFALHEMPLSVRQTVLREMLRVTKRDGTIVVIDYDLPHNVLFRPLVYSAVKVYERDHYAQFMRTDLLALLEGLGMHVRTVRHALFGVARVVVASKRDESTQPSTESHGSPGSHN
jgi:demethylmenaquinone methyltransferase/2-methoxy-6-polyprenyl-1,4-benzoquinol methylase